MSRVIRRLDEATKAKDLTGKVYIVTGANSGVGLETTRQLVKQGAHVVMACRRVEAGQEAASSFKDLKGSAEVISCDLTDLQTVRDFAKSFLQRHNRLDGLACNAGMVSMGNDPVYTADGFELTLASSYIGHFLMTEMLLDVLKKTEQSRFVIVSSVVHARNTKDHYKVHLDDLHFKKREYSNFAAYGEAKVAVVLYAKELAERLKDFGVATASVHPGWARSNFGSGGNFIMRTLMAITRPLTRSMSDSNEDSAQTTLHCLLSDDARNHSGAYFSQSSVLYRDKEHKNGGWPLETPNPHAKDMETARALVAMSYNLVGMES